MCCHSLSERNSETSLELCWPPSFPPTLPPSHSPRDVPVSLSTLYPICQDYASSLLCPWSCSNNKKDGPTLKPSITASLRWAQLVLEILWQVQSCEHFHVHAIFAMINTHLEHVDCISLQTVTQTKYTQSGTASSWLPGSFSGWPGCPCSSITPLTSWSRLIPTSNANGVDGGKRTFWQRSVKPKMHKWTRRKSPSHPVHRPEWTCRTNPESVTKDG